MCYFVTYNCLNLGVITFPFKSNGLKSNILLQNLQKSNAVTTHCRTLQLGGWLPPPPAPLWRPRATALLARPPRPLRRRLFPPAPTLLSRSPPYSPGLPPGSRDRSRRRRCRPTGARGAHSGRPPLNWPLNQDCGVASGLPPLVLQLAEPELRDRACQFTHTIK